MTSFARRACLSGLLGPVVATAAFSQQLESPTLGKVLDSSQAALPGVTVTVTSKDTGAVRTVVTEGDGSYTVTNLSPGTYDVAFELSGFATKKETVVLGIAQVQNTNATLGVAAV